MEPEDTHAATHGQEAPGALEMVQCFANTINIEDNTDELVKPDDLQSTELLRRWLLDHRLISTRERVSAEDLARALELREAIRAMALGNHGEPVSREAPRVLDRTAQRAGIAVRFRAEGAPMLEPRSPGTDGALGRLVAIIFGAMSDGTWGRLKICRSDTCAWVFYDHSKNQSRAWCSMRICGNRTKVRTYRRREAAQRSAS